MFYSSLCHSVPGTGTDLAVSKHMLNEEINICFQMTQITVNNRKRLEGKTIYFFIYCAQKVIQITGSLVND